MRQILLTIVLTLTILIGGGGLLAFITFLYGGPYSRLDLGLSTIGVLLFDTSLSLVFFLQHSGMVRKRLRQLMQRVLPRVFIGPLYNLLSGIVILILVLLWQSSPELLFSARGWIRIAFRGLFFFGLILIPWVMWTLGPLRNFRLVSIVDQIRGAKSRPKSLVLHGPYRWVRHPLYLASLSLIWSNPDMTLDRLAMNLLFTGWVVLACTFEERRLVGEYGDAYREYQRRVPMLLPLKLSVGRRPKLWQTES